MLTATPKTVAHRAALSASAKERHAAGGVPNAPDNLPVTILRAELTLARRAGVSFTDAWPDALDRAVSPCRSADDEKGWRLAFEATEGAWLAAWNREGSSCFSALSVALIVV